MLDSNLMLKNNELCMFGSAVVRGGMREAGMFLRDTRFLSDFEVRLDGEPCDVLAVRPINDQEVAVTLANTRLAVGGVEVLPRKIVIQQRIRLDRELRVELMVESYLAIPGGLDLGITIAADFFDMFEVRGMASPRHPEVTAVASADGLITFAATDATEGCTELEITCDPVLEAQPSVVTRPADGRDEARASLHHRLTPSSGSSSRVAISMRPTPVGTEPLSLAALAETGQDSGFVPVLQVRSNSPLLDGFVDRCDRDLALLYTSFPGGPITAAGIPWYMTPFGRDSLITALQTVHVYPQRSASALRVLAVLQGKSTDAFREEEPGKIPHEMRYGAMARNGIVPHSPYYGSIDATPLFVMAFAEHDRWHRDDDLFASLLPHVHRALDWIDRHCMTGGGLPRYAGTPRDQGHISQQGWKDSVDSLHFADGRSVEGPVALVEVQGYVYAAYAWLATVIRARGDETWADELAVRAEKMRTVVETRFWDEASGFYAQALDGSGNRVDSMSSNPGHLLYCGLPGEERAARVAAHLGSDEMLTAWGIRTLSSAMATYNPTSYHNGSVWPHDTSLAMAGLMRYGHVALATDVALRLITTSRFSPDQRLDELYCGYDDHPDAGPVPYPVTCRPQAWAAGAGLLALRTMLGIEPGKASRQPSATFLEQVTSLDARPFSSLGNVFGVTVTDGEVRSVPL